MSLWCRRQSATASLSWSPVGDSGSRHQEVVGWTVPLTTLKGSWEVLSLSAWAVKR